jgi:hypothetical protein
MCWTGGQIEIQDLDFRSNNSFSAQEIGARLVIW